MAIKSGLGYSPLSEKVYWGKQNDKKPGVWASNNKIDVTNNFLDVSFAYFEENTVRTIATNKTKHLFIHVKEDAASLKKIIKMLQKKLTKTT